MIPDAGIGALPVNFLHLVFGVPFMLLGQLFADTVFAGLSSREPQSDADREWFGRSSGWFLTVAILWLAILFLVFFGTIIGKQTLKSSNWDYVKTVIPVIAAVTGWITATFGSSTVSPIKGEAKGIFPYLSRLILPVAAILFSTAMLVIISYLLDLMLFHESLLDAKESQPVFLLLVAGLFLSVVLSVIASRCININRFSLHAVYRNRLVRAFLGAVRDRKPDAFTGFDSMDNLPMHELWSAPEPGNWRPFHIINIALNVVSSNRLAWQERKAEPFTVSPLHCGSSRLGYRESREYGGQDGISLGTAMAISGAAASPNMGYHSSPSVTFLMSIFNVRLGWWLGNPGEKGNDCYRKEGPDFAILPLLTEAFGLTTDDRKYVYLSDGGHFENLGLYEMVRRRCRFIVVSDASCDPNFEFQDLGDAVRKIGIDLGISIRFRNLDRLTNRSQGETGSEHSYHAIGEIDYRAADGGGSNGYVLYLKPAYHGIEDAAVRAYATANLDFPHQSTMNQWFTESQFESYRALGFEITDRILSRACNEEAYEVPTLENLLAGLHERATKFATADSAVTASCCENGTSLL